MLLNIEKYTKKYTLTSESYAVGLNLQNWSEMKWAIYQLAILLVLIIADVGTAIYDRYVSDTNQSVCMSKDKSNS
jgi:hypothetical protein